MKLIYPKGNIGFVLEQGRLNSIVIEDSRLLEEMVVGIYNDIYNHEENFKLIDGENDIVVSKIISLIMTPVDFEYSKREINKNFLSYLKSEMDETDISQRIAEKYAEMKALIDELFYVSEIPFEYDDLIAESDIFKNFDIHIKHPEGIFCEKAIEYIEVLKRLSDKKLIVFANCEAYLEENDYEFIEKQAISEGMYVLFLSNRQFMHKVEMNQCIIDIDLCELY